VDEIEELLKHYRPVGPPPDLRARLTTPSRGDDARASVAAWLLVAATLFCAALFYMLAAREHQRMVMRIPPPVAEVSREPFAEPWP
jgi:hypothetical protein